MGPEVGRFIWVIDVLVADLRETTRDTLVVGFDCGFQNKTMPPLSRDQVQVFYAMFALALIVTNHEAA